MFPWYQLTTSIPGQASPEFQKNGIGSIINKYSQKGFEEFQHFASLKINRFIKRYKDII